MDAPVLNQQAHHITRAIRKIKKNFPNPDKINQDFV